MSSTSSSKVLEMSTANLKGPISGLGAVLASLLETGLYSDMTVKCQGRVWNLHKAVVFPQSEPLAAHLSGDFKESVTNEITLSDDDPKTLNRLIQFLYKETFDDKPTAVDVSEDSRLIICTKVYVLAEKYDISALKQLAKSKFEKAVATDWNDGSLAAVLNMVYTELPESDYGLKDTAIKAVSEHIKDLVDRGEFVDFCKQNGEVAFDVIKGSLGGNTLGQCPQHPIHHRNNISWNVNKSQFYCNSCGVYFK